MENNKFLEFTDKGATVVISLMGIITINKTHEGGALLNGMLTVDQKFDDVLEALESLGASVIVVGR